MLIDCLLGIAWIAIVLLPAIVASRHPVVSHNGYIDNYMDPAGKPAPRSGAAADSARMR